MNLAPITYPLASLISTRQAYGETLSHCMDTDDRIMVLDAEMSNSTMAEIVKKAHPERFFEMYLTEQNMMSVADGLSCRGRIPFVSSFSSFLTRAHDQIRMASYGKANIKIMGAYGGLALGVDGGSQMGLEDIAMMRSILRSVVLYPCDATSMARLVVKSIEHEGMVYLRGMRDPMPVLYDANEQFPFGGCKVWKWDAAKKHAVILKYGKPLTRSGDVCHPVEQRDPMNDIIPLDTGGSLPRTAIRGRYDESGIKASTQMKSHRMEQSHDFVIIGAGPTFHEALKAQKALVEKGVKALVVDLYSIKPIDTQTLLSVTKGVEKVVVVEDHYEAGGIGEAVRSAIGNSGIPIDSLAVRQMPHSGKVDELYRYEEIDSEAIMNAILK